MKKILFALLCSTQLMCATSLLVQMSDELNQISEKAMPATVFIKAQIQCTQQHCNPFQEDFFRQFFGDSNPFQQQQQQPQVSGGSGFVIRADGYIVTNNHVVKDASEITVLLGDGREYKATVKGSDPRTDLAVLKIEEKDLPFLTFGDSDKLKVGELVIAIGNPFGLEASLTLGVVSAKGRQDIGIASYEDFIQTDAAINPGNSGGPLLNPLGEVIGVNTAIMSRSGGYMGIGLSIPSNMAQNVIDQIIDGGTVKRGFLGVMLQPLDKDTAEALGLDKQDGALVSEVVKDSPAEKAGILQGDVILTCNGKPTKNVQKLRNDIGLLSPGSTLELRILRNGKQQTISVQLSSQSETQVAATESVKKLGLELETLTPELARKNGCPDLEGVVITKVEKNSPAAQAGLSPGLVITGVAFNNFNNPNNKRAISNIRDFDAAMQELVEKKYKFLMLIVRQQNYQRIYTLRVN